MAAVAAAAVGTGAGGLARRRMRSLGRRTEARRTATARPWAAAVPTPARRRTARRRAAPTATSQAYPQTHRPSLSPVGLTHRPTDSLLPVVFGRRAAREAAGSLFRVVCVGEPDACVCRRVAQLQPLVRVGLVDPRGRGAAHPGPRRRSPPRRRRPAALDVLRRRPSVWSAVGEPAGGVNRRSPGLTA